jgi:hypothetical protein
MTGGFGVSLRVAVKQRSPCLLGLGVLQPVEAGPVAQPHCMGPIPSGLRVAPYIAGLEATRRRPEWQLVRGSRLSVFAKVIGCGLAFEYPELLVTWLSPATPHVWRRSVSPSRRWLSMSSCLRF